MKIVEIWSNWFGFGSADRTCWFGRTTEPTEPSSSAEPGTEPESSVVHYISSSLYNVINFASLAFDQERIPSDHAGRDDWGCFYSHLISTRLLHSLS